MASVCFPDDFRHGRMLRYIAPLMERACRPTLTHAERWWQLSSEDPAQSIGFINESHFRIVHRGPPRLGVRQ